MSVSPDRACPRALDPGAELPPLRMTAAQAIWQSNRRKRRLEVAIAVVAGLLVAAAAWCWPILMPAVVELLR